jgi:hypothetical protein
MMAVADADKGAGTGGRIKRAPEDDGRGSIYADANTQCTVELWRTNRFKLLNETNTGTSHDQNAVATRAICHCGKVTGRPSTDRANFFAVEGFPRKNPCTL